MDVNIRDWTFTHWWVRPVVKVWFDIYHKSVTYSGTENIDWQKPIIFAPSHQNAFSDALCLILPTRYTDNRFIYPLIRADAFGKSKVLDWMLTVFHMMPVYRPRDNVNLKRENESVFAHCYEILSKHRNLLIHPEGNCIAEKRVRRFKKGLARIAFGAEQEHNFNLGVQVVPVGINYENITEARGGIHIRYGRPITVADFKARYTEHAARAVTELTQKVRQRVKEVTVDIQSSENYQLTEQFIRLNKKLTPKFADEARYSKREVEFEKKVVETLEKTEQEKSGITERLKENFRELTAALDKNNLTLDHLLIESSSVSRLCMEGIAYLIFLPIFLYGWINNIIPWHLTHKLADSVKERQFKSSLRMVSGLLLFPMCYGFQGIMVWWFTGSLGWSAVYLFSLPFTGILSLNTHEKWTAWRQQLRLKLMSERERIKLSNLLENIKELEASSA